MSIDHLVGILGWPVSHSLSPIMHNAAFLHQGLSSWCYVPIPVDKYPFIRIKEAVLGLRALGFFGANVTVPYKEAVVPYLDRLSDSAKAIGAVNTIVIEEGGQLIGHNTDAQGFINDLLERGINVHAMEALILGAGGSARAIAYALLSNGCRKLAILNRTQAKSDDIKMSLTKVYPDILIETGLLDREHIERYRHLELVVNCTSVGMLDSVQDMPWEQDISFVPDQIVYDLIYKPAQTALLKKAREDHAQAISGLGMLIHQGALAFKLWTGIEAPLNVMKEAVHAKVD